MWGRTVTQHSCLQVVEPANVIRPAESSSEGFNNLHGAAAPRARGCWFEAGNFWVVVIIVISIVIALNRPGGHNKQASATCKLVGAMTVGKEAVVTDTMEAIRQDVQEETARELGNRESHDFALVTATFLIVVPTEADVGLVEIEQASVGNRNPMGIAREIGQELLGTGEGLFGIDDPFDSAQGREGSGKSFASLRLMRSVKNCSSPASNAALRPSRNRRRKQAREHANR
jgi:hypothetical protein